MELAKFDDPIRFAIREGKIKICLQHIIICTHKLSLVFNLIYSSGGNGLKMLSSVLVAVVASKTSYHVTGKGCLRGYYFDIIGVVVILSEKISYFYHRKDKVRSVYMMNMNVRSRGVN